MEEGGPAVVVGGQFGEAGVICPGDWGEAGVGRGSEDGAGGLGLAYAESMGRADVQDGLFGDLDASSGLKGA